MKIFETDKKEDVIEKKEQEEKNNIFKKEVLDTIADYQSYNMGLDEAISATANLLKMNELEVKSLIPESEKNSNNSKEITLESVMKKLSETEQEFLKGIIEKEKKDDKDDDKDEPEKIEKKDENVFIIEKEWVIPGTEIILEKGDEIRVVPIKKEHEEN